MGKKVFVSYKYSDSNVYPLQWVNPRQGLTILGGYQSTTVRHYVDELQALLDAEDNINKGENDDESLEGFKDSTIASKLRDKIFDSSITVVMISPNMKASWPPESDQWIPWEISYSLSEHSRGGITSRSNAVLAVVLPDGNNSYSYFIQDKICCSEGCKALQTDTLFQILRLNMFNAKAKTRMDCTQGSIVYRGAFSYIDAVKWSDFKTNVNTHLNNAIRAKDNIDNYDITKQVA